ncbi:MAG: ATP-binding domain-containing protein [Myxococcales bacterium]|nr:ATP-binding domain-containing protein [Myxococcales bacterium]
MKPVRENSEAHDIVREELRLLGRVTSTISELSTKHAGTPDYDEALINLRDQIAEAKPEDIAALVEQMTRISAIAQRYGKGRDLPIDPESPYFAHMRLEEDERKRDVLIGKRGFIDRDRNVQIVDWRNAPVSRIYYRYEEGDDYEERFGGKILEGQVTARRTLTIEEGKLIRVGCPQGTYFAGESGDWFEAEKVARAELAGGQGKAARPPRRGDASSTLGAGVGGKRADKHLPEIAALIDPTQFELIARPDSGLVVLQGGAGTGKTTVALHRVAFLNYQAPKRFRPERMLVVVPSVAMVRYVERVLPSLGVPGVRVQTSRDWFGGMRRRLLGDERTEVDDGTPSLVMRFKKHPMLIAVLEAHVKKQVAACERELRQAVGKLPGGQRVLRCFDDERSRPLARRALHVRDFVHEQRDLPAVTRQRAEAILTRVRRRTRDLLADWSEILTDAALLNAAVAEHAAGEFSEKDITQVVEHCVRQLADIAAADMPSDTRKSDDDDDDDDTYIAADGVDERSAVRRTAKLDPPDDALLIYLHLLKQGALRPPGSKPIRYEHLVVDEAQDLSAVEIKVLLEATSENHCVTIAGDTQQRLVFDNHFSDWETLLSELGADIAQNSTLELGYRSTSEVMSLARSLLGELAAPDATRAVRSGAPVELHRFTSQGEAVGMLAEALRSLAAREPLASVALITRYPAQAYAWADALVNAEVPSVRCVRDQDFSFKPGIEVTDVSQVKGLEFDYVVLLDVTRASYPESTESRHLLHIAATRAAHQLWLVATGPASPVLPKTL